MKKDYLRMFQEGGQMPSQDMAPAPAQGAEQEGGTNPDEMLAAVIQTQDPQLALEFCNMLGQQMGLTPGGAPQEAQPMGRYGIKVPKPIRIRL